MLDAQLKNQDPPLTPFNEFQQLYELTSFNPLSRYLFSSFTFHGIGFPPAVPDSKAPENCEVFRKKMLGDAKLHAGLGESGGLAVAATCEDSGQ